MNSARDSFERRLLQLKRRLMREASIAVAMLEAALKALWNLDVDAAKRVRRSDDRVDQEEVQIELQAYQLLTLEQPVARDFRILAFILKANSDIERVADHATSIAKLVARFQPPPGAMQWPTALRDLGERVPMSCHQLMRAVLDENAEAARAVVAADETIDRLDRQLFREAVDLITADPQTVNNGLLMYRISRELERVGDLMASIAEEVVYLVTGEIIRHAGKKKDKAAG